MEDFRKQHIVPQAYLQRFAVLHGEKYIIGTRLSSEKGTKLFTRNVADVAYIENYYDTCAKEDIKFWEHYLDKKFERLCGRVLGNIVSKITLSSDSKKVLTKEQKSILSRIILSQAVRVPCFLDYQIHQSDITIDKYKNEIMESLSDSSDSFRELVNQIHFKEDERKDIILSGVFDEKRFNKFCHTLEEKVWIVFYNQCRQDMPFITSDNPVLFSDIKGKNVRVTEMGLEHERMVVFYPVSPTILIGIYSPNIYFGKFCKYDGQRIAIDDKKFIMKVNFEIMNQSYIHSFLPEPLFTTVKTT